MKIVAKLLIGFVAIAVLCAVVGVVGVIQLGSMEKSLTSMTTHTIPALELLSDVEVETLKLKVAIRSLAVPDGLDDKTYTARQKSNIEASRSVYKAALEQYKALPMVAEEKRLFGILEPLLAKAASFNDEIIAKTDEARVAAPEQRAAIMQEVYDLLAGERRLEFDNMLTALNDLHSYDSKYYGTDLPAQAISAGKFSSVALVGVTILSFLAAIGVGILLGQSISRALAKALRAVKSLAAGDVSEKLEIRSKDEIGMIAVAINTCFDTVNALVSDALMLSKAAVDGKLATRADPGKHQGDYRKIVEGVNATLDAVIGPLNVAASYVDSIAKGDIPKKISDSYNGDFNLIKNNLNLCIDTVNALVEDSLMLSKAAVEGKLATRADPGKHQGDYRKIVVGVNATLDAVIGPLNVAATYVDSIAKGDIPKKITDSYNGDFNLIKNNLNLCIDTVNALVEDSLMLSKAAVEGKLATRADASKHQGDYRKIVEGVNATLDAVIGPLNVAAAYVDNIAKGDIPKKITDSYNGDFNLIKNNLNLCIDTVNALVADALMLSKAAVEGKLATRADPGKHQGDYRKIVEGVNATLDAVIGPLNVAASYVDSIARGDIPRKITDSYNGDFNLIKNNLNLCIDSVNALVEDSLMLSKAAVEGKLATRADANKHLGDYRKIVEGVNKTLDLVIDPINETIAVMKKLAEGDLTTYIESAYAGDFDTLKQAISASLDSFNDIIGQVNIAVDQVAEGAQQVSQASQSLSQGATEQASSLEEITSSITEISSQTKQNTESAIQVNGLAKKAKSNAEQGNQQMQTLVAAMTDINKSADEINKIVKTIDDISFQINLLALNANVEAARAGKYGKGFAVVAEEVRNLAVRSANSVKDTTRMVEETITNINRGNSLVEVTAKQLVDIVEGASQVAVLAEEVATAGKEQTQGLEQISLGLSQIDQVTQANTASAEQSASASEELSSQSQQVKAMLSRFRIKARESKMSNAEMMQLLKSELAKQGQHPKAHAAAEVRPAKPHAGKPGVNPSDVISLDDGDFGKF
jgi:methyl-accepting chemotaxis protein